MNAAVTAPTAGTEVMTYREALRLALREELARDERVFLMGEEVGVFEGAYKVSAGLLDEFGPDRANYLPDPGLKRQRGTRPVGSYPPNGFGLYDMAGNVGEWVADWYRADAYAHEGGEARPAAPGLLRLLRGGSWVSHDVQQLRCAHRHKVPLDSYAYSIGFRVVYSELADGDGAEDATAG